MAGFQERALPRRRLRAAVASVVMLLGITTAMLTASSETAEAAEVFVVNSTLDAVDVNPGNGVCATGASTCTLRAAIQEANAVGGPDIIQVPAGTYTLTVFGAAEDLSGTGDLDVTGPVTITGAGAGSTIVDGNGSDRVLHLLETAGNVTITGLTIRDGLTEEDGAGIFSVSGGTLVLDAVTVTANSTGSDGGGIHTTNGTLRVRNGSVVSANSARNGGGIFNGGELSVAGVPSQAFITASTITGNTAIEGGGGGVWNDHEGSLTLTDVTVTDNVANDNGGGVAAVSKSSLTVNGGSFSGNQAHGEGGGLYTATERAVRVTGTSFTGNEAGVPTELEAGEGGGGALNSGGDGVVEIVGSTFEGNSAPGEGGAIYLDNNGSVAITDSVVRGNESGAGGGGIQNAATRVTFTRLLITENRATLDGGGVESQGSGAFTIIDSTISRNTAENGGGFANAADGSTRIERTLLWDNRALVGLNDDSGLGGGVYALGDSGSVYENITIANNFAQTRGGGFYVDADAGVRVSNSTIVGNSSPIASGAGGEIGSINFPIQPSTSVIFRNTIVAGNLLGSNCSFAIGSEGGNLQGDTSCHFIGPKDRTVADPGLDSVANNGGPTMTMAIQPDSLALDGGVNPCPLTDQRGVARPQNTICDSGAYESEGPFLPPDTEPPDTQYLTGPIQDTENTSAFTFTGTDNQTAPEHLLFECRLIETEIGEPPEPPDPTAPPEPELAWVGCQNPWQVPIIEDGLFSFEVRAIDRAGSVDPTPAVHTFGGTLDLTPPQTFILESPPNPSSTNTATFTFAATDNQTPEQFIEFECRIDTIDPDAWLECTNPAVYSNLTLGEHTFQVRATDGNDNIDPTPATFTWTVEPALDCDLANITLVADADVYVDQESPGENFVVNPQLVVRSGDLATNARTLIRFPVGSSTTGCTLQSAVLRMYAGSGELGRVLQAIPLAGGWTESGATWNNQPGTTGAAATTTSGDGYREWDVTAQVAAMLAGDLANNGWLIRDAVEDDLEGAAQAFLSRETPQDPPDVTLPQLVLRYDASGTPPPPAPSPGAPGTLACGDVVTESIVLQNDLLNCLGEGLVIGAPDIEVDLNGHVISSGLVIEPGEEDGLFAGIRNGGHANVVIRNGTVRNFGYGVRLMAGVRFNVVEGMTLEGNINAGVELFDADDGRNGNIVRNNTFRLNGDGVALVSGSEGSTVVGNTFLGNLGRAVYLFNASGNSIANNTASGLTNDPLLDSDGGIFLEASSNNTVLGNILTDTGDAGLQLSAGSHRNRLAGNTVARTSDSGISVDDSDGTEIVDNVVHRSGGAGISLGNAHDGVITGNDARFNPGGIELGGGSSGNLVQDNDVTGSLAAGISVEGGLGNEILDNTASNTQATGISVEAEAVDTLGNPIPGNVIEGNTANGNLGDGISVSAGGHVVTANEAHNNAAFGITAGEFVVDGGGNTASGNGEPEQCVGVVCTPGTAPPATDPDLTAPDTEILTAPANGTSTLDPQVFTFTGTDNVSPETALRYECRLDAPPDPPAEPPEPPEPGEPPEPVEPPPSESWHECGNPTIYSFLPSGEHTFEVRAIDPFDNVDLTPDSYTWTVVAAPPGADSIPPSTTISEAPPDPSTSTTATFAFRGTDNATPGPSLVFECSLDGAGFAPCTSPVTFTGLSLATHSFEVQARDLQGNVDPTPAVHTWTVVAPDPDTTAPDTTIDSGPDLTTVVPDATFTFSSDEDDVTFECSLDGGLFEPCTSPQNYADLDVDAHTFAVRAVDAAGNPDPTPATYDWTVTDPPVAAAVTCGQVLTQSTQLTNDLLDCPADGLVIGAPGITVDLAGHTIDGTNLGFGIANNGFDSVTVLDGVIQEFDAGVHLSNGTSRNIVSGLTLQLNELAGVQLTNADEAGNGNIVRDNTVAGNGGGIALLSGTQHAHVLRNIVAGNAGIGVHVLSSSANRIEANEISGSSDASVSLEGASGNTIIGNTVLLSADASIVVHLGSNDNRIEANHLTEGEAGVLVDSSNRNQVIDNVAHDMGDSGIVLTNAHDGLVKGNDVRFNSGGIEMDASTGNRIEANNASETGGAGIEVGDASVRNVFVQNVASANEANGIAIETFAAPGSGNLLDANIADDNTGDGIYVGDVGHMIRANTANNNSEWGIYAADATVAGMNLDGGGNRATGNTGGEVDPLTLLPLQCKNVVCDGSPPPPADVVAPTTAISAAPLSPTLQTTATFSFTGSDNASAVVFQCRLDSTDAADFLPCTSPHTYTGLGLGTHTFEARAVDFTGNVDQSPATHTWTIEAPAVGVAPDTTIDSGPDATTASTTASFTFSSNEPGVTFECSLDSAAFVTCSSPQTYSGLGVGPHTFAVQAVDTESLTDLSPATFTWTVTAPSAPASVSCGQLITASTLVTNDLLDCLGNGLVIGANNITLDLAGHVIDGTGLGVGILNNGFDNVTITNGIVQEFDFGVQLGDGTAGNVVSELTLQLNQEAAIQLVDADNGAVGNTIRANTLVGNNYGIWLTDGTQFATVRANTITASSADGIRLDGSSGNRIEANTVSESSGAGVALAASNDNTIVGNTLSNNSGAGVALGETLLAANGNLVEGNTMTANSGAGISVVESSGNELIGNTATQGGSSGIELELATDTVIRGNDVGGNAAGIELSDSSDNVIEGNNASGSNGGGISVEGVSLRNVIRLNNASGNSGEGISVNDATDAANGNLIDRNIASSNSGDGISVNGAGHTITANTVNFNDGWGIFAVPGNIDGGGNEASGNAEPTQCAGVVCTISAAPGAPDTEIVDRPSNPSDSQNALFTFIGTDDTTPLADLGFECRLDSTDPLGWVECDNPQEYFGLSPGPHTFDVRAVDASDQVDPTPDSYTWIYDPLPSGVAPDTFIDIGPPLASPLFEGIFTFSSNEPDVTFECSLDGGPFETCEFAYEFAFEETQAGQHTFQVRATDFEGNTDPTPATYTWTVTGVLAIVTDGPAFIPPEDPLEPAEGGETSATTATIVFEANVADAQFFCSLDLEPFAPCASPFTRSDLAVGEHVFRVFAFDVENEVEQLEPTEYSWTVLPGEDLLPPDTTITSAPVSGTSDTVFTFTGTDDQTQPLALTFECRLDSTLETDWIGCISPFNLLQEFPDFAPGPHTFEVRANDNAEPLDPNAPSEGNVDPTPAVHTWTSVADTTAPETTLLTTPVSPTIEPDVEFTFSGTDNATPELQVTFECSVNGDPFEPCDSPESVQGLVPGEQTFAVRAVDLALNPDPTPALFTWTLIGPPVTTITSGPDPVTGSQDAEFTFAADQAGVTFACTIDGGAFLPCSSPASYTGLTDGEHTFEVQATNSFGLIEVEPASFTWTVESVVDTTPPQTTLTATPAAVILVGETVFEFTANEVGATFQCSLDGAALQNCDSPHELSGLLDGEHTFVVQAVDAAGNIDPTPESYTWTVDLPPVAEILTGPAEATESTEATFTFAANEPVAGFECFLDGVTEPCTSPVNHTGLSLGAHVFAVRAVDDTPSLEAAFEDHDWTILAAAAPNTSFVSGPPALDTSTTATFTFSGIDNLTSEDALTFECSLDGADFAVCASPLELTDLSATLHTLEVRAVDESDTPDPTPAIYTWTVTGPDVTPPETFISSGPAATTTITDATFVLVASEPGSTFECSLDGAGFAACESPHLLGDLPLGAHTLEVRATDAAGNVDASPASYPWTVVADTAAPDTTITAGPVGVNTSVDVELQFTGSDDTTLAADLDFECSSDGGAFEPCSSPHQLQDLTEGGHTFQVRAIDEALNVDATPAERIWTTVDSVPPETNIDTGPESPTEATTATFTFSSNDPAATFECSLDGASFTACLSGAEIAGIGVGDHTFRVRARDVGGNVDATPDLYEWTVVSPDAPDTSIATGPPAVTDSTVATFTFSSDQPGVTFECSLNGALFVGCETPHEEADLAVGTHELQVRAVDAADKADPTPAVLTWTVVAATPPETSFGTVPPATTESTSATITFSSDVAGAEFQCSLDGAAFAHCEPPVELSGLSLGGHTFAVRAVDLLGNPDPTPAEHAWTVEAPAPPPVQCDDTETYAADGDSWIDQGSPSDNKGTDSVLKVMSKGPSNNLRALVRFALPASLPEGCVVESATLRLFAASSASGRTLQVMRITEAWTENGVTWSNQPATTGPAVTTTSGSGYRTWDVSTQVQDLFASGANHGFLVRDLNENQDAEQQLNSREKGEDLPQLVVTFAAAPPPDTTAPVTSFTVEPEPTTEDTSASFEFGADEAGVTYECSLDGDPFAHCYSPEELTGLEPGEHTFAVRSTDPAGNVGDPTSVTWTVAEPPAPPADTTAPVTTITAEPPATTEDTSASFEFGADEAGVTFACALDSDPFAACTSPVTLSGLGTGEHTFSVRATDGAGNVGSAASVTWTVEEPAGPPPDTTPPQTSLDATPPATSTSSSASFGFSADEAGSTFECSLDGAAFAACTSPVVLTGLATGSHTFAVRATDPAGNTDATPASHTWTRSAPSCPANTTLISVADAWLEQNSPSSNKGSDSDLKVKAQGSNDNFRAVVRFNPPALPEGCVVQSATLRLRAGSSKSGRTLQAIQLNAAWAENTVTWGNQPPTTGPAATTPSGNNWRQWTVTAQVQAMYTAGAHHGFLVRDANESGSGAEQVFYSREKGGGDRPQLVISYTAAG